MKRFENFKMPKLLAISINHRILIIYLVIAQKITAHYLMFNLPMEKEIQTGKKVYRKPHLAF